MNPAKQAQYLWINDAETRSENCMLKCFGEKLAHLNCGKFINVEPTWIEIGGGLSRAFAPVHDAGDATINGCNVGQTQFNLFAYNCGEPVSVLILNRA